MAGQLERFDELAESHADFSRWQGSYETWQRWQDSVTITAQAATA